MQFTDYLKQLGTAGVDDYAKRCGTSAQYILIKLRYASCVPRPRLMRALADESQGACSFEEILAHFHGVRDQQQPTTNEAA